MNRWLRSVQTIFNEKSNEESNVFEENLRKVNFKEEVKWLQNYIEAQNFTVVCIKFPLIGKFQEIS